MTVHTVNVSTYYGEKSYQKKGEKISLDGIASEGTMLKKEGRKKHRERKNTSGEKNKYRNRKRKNTFCAGLFWNI